MPILKALLDRPDLDVNSVLNLSEGESALHLAVSRSMPVTFPILLNRADIDVNAKDLSGRTPLMLAVSSTQSHFVQSLVADPWIDINAQCVDGRTALHRFFDWRN